MSLTNFPFGLSSFGIPLIGSGPVLTTGRVFFVNSATGTDAPGYGVDKDRPFDTINFAISQCTANRGDVIFVMPGHVETVTAAAGLDLDAAGVSIIGIGQGESRPVIDLTTATTADIDIDAASITLQNFIIKGNVDALAAVIDVNASDFKLYNCEYRDVTGQCTVFILTDANASRMHVKGLVYRGDTAAGTGAAIAIVGGDGIVIEDFDIIGNFSVGVFDVRTTATTNLKIRNGFARTTNAADIILVDTITGSTGLIGPDINARLQDNAANITEAFTGATFVYFQPINIVNLAGESSMQTNITASTDA